MPAGVATAIIINWVFIFPVAGVGYIEGAKTGKKLAVSGIAAGHDAVEHVRAHGGQLHQVLGGADTHDVAWFISGQQGQGGGGHLHHQVFGLAHAQAADGISGKIDFRHLFGRYFRKSENMPPWTIPKRWLR